MTLAEVAELVGGRLEGDAQVVLRDVAPLDEAGTDELGLLADRRYLERAEHSRAGALLVANALASSLSGERPYVAVDDAHAALVPLLERFHPPSPWSSGIHPTASLGARVRLGEDVTIGPYAVVEEDCVLDDRCRIGPHVVLGRGSRVGEGTILHASVTLYPGTEIGRRVIVHAGCRIGVDGFGYAVEQGTFRKVPQVGGCVVEDDVEIGANTCIDRGSIGDTRIGKGCKLDNLVHVAHNVRIDRHSALAAQVGIAGSTRIGKGVVFGGQSGAAGHIEVGDGVQVGAQSGVLKSFSAGERVAGFPARDATAFFRSTAQLFRLTEVRKRLDRLEEEVRKLSER
jgi:UDP-3-O-[3-hydroxymyristoyl] glucosamine N-acyltransferase